jgi:TfoX/Sxy family transcriptional regulator of competence genes
MTYDEKLAGRVRRALARRKGLAEKKMFGGISFMVGGNMCCGVVNDDLVVRVGLEDYEKALAEPHARPMDFTGRPLKGFVFVGPDGYRTDKALSTWLKRAVDFAASLPVKERRERSKGDDHHVGTVQHDQNRLAKNERSSLSMQQPGKRRVTAREREDR